MSLEVELQGGSARVKTAELINLSWAMSRNHPRSAHHLAILVTKDEWDALRKHMADISWMREEDLPVRQITIHGVRVLRKELVDGL